MSGGLDKEYRKRVIISNGVVVGKAIVVLLLGPNQKEIHVEDGGGLQIEINAPVRAGSWTLCLSRPRDGRESPSVTRVSYSSFVLAANH